MLLLLQALVLYHHWDYVATMNILPEKNTESNIQDIGEGSGVFEDFRFTTSAFMLTSTTVLETTAHDSRVTTETMMKDFEEGSGDYEDISFNTRASCNILIDNYLRIIPIM